MLVSNYFKQKLILLGSASKKKITWVKYLSNCTPTPPLAQQKSTDNKLRSKLSEEIGKCSVAQILTLMRLRYTITLSLYYLCVSNVSYVSIHLLLFPSSRSRTSLWKVFPNTLQVWNVHHWCHCNQFLLTFRTLRQPRNTSSASHAAGDASHGPCLLLRLYQNKIRGYMVMVVKRRNNTDGIYIRILFLNIDKAFKWKPENLVTLT